MARNRKRGSRVTPKGTRPRNWEGGGPPLVPQPRPEHEFVVAVRRELQESNAFGFLNYVSSLAALSDERCKDPFSREDDVVVESLLLLLDTLAEVGSRETDALIVGLAALACNQEERAQASRLVDAFTDRQWIRLPTWLQRLHETTVVRAGCQRDHGGDWSNEMLEFDVVGESFVLMLTVNHNAAHALNGGYSALASIDEVQQFAHQHRDMDVIHEQVELSEAAARFVHAIERDAMTVPRTETETWPTSRALFEWVVRLVGPADGSAFDYQEFDASFEAETMARFLASPTGFAAAKSGATAHLDSLWWYAAGYGHARPLVWGPERVSELLMYWFPRKVMSPGDDAAGFPALVRAWVEFAHGETGVPMSYTSEVLEAIDAAEPAFFAAIRKYDEDDPDDEWFGGAFAGRAGSGDGEDHWPFDDDAEAEWESRSHRALATLAEQIRESIAAAVGPENYETITDEPLPIELFDVTGIDPEKVEVAKDWAHHIEQMCDALLEDEIKTACFRLLRKIALAAPAVFRPLSRADRAALSLVWAVCVANERFRSHGRAGRAVEVGELVAFYDAPPSGHTGRAGTLLRAIGIARASDGSMHLGDPGLLTGDHRRRLIERREKHRDR